MFAGMKKRFARLINGEYPLDFIVYKLFCRHGLIGRFFPMRLYRIVENRINQIGPAKELYLQTYDGLNQATHPSACVYNGTYYLAVTPFPYGNDMYENPCLYMSKNGQDFLPINGCFPIITPHAHNMLIYLSDPYLYFENNELILLYRECVYNSKNTYTAIIYSISIEDENITEPREIFKSDMGAMSPCINVEGGETYLYYVEFEGKGTVLKKKNINSGLPHDVNICGLPSDLMLWHLDIIRMDSQETIGLFTLSSDHYGSGARLFVAKYEKEFWTIGREIVFDNQTVTKMYKSCVVKMKDDSYRLVVSLRRKDRKWKIYYLDGFRYQDYV